MESVASFNKHPKYPLLSARVLGTERPWGGQGLAFPRRLQVWWAVQRESDGSTEQDVESGGSDRAPRDRVLSKMYPDVTWHR